jgi:hypothetical protein
MKEHPLILAVALVAVLVVALTGVEFSCNAQTQLSGGTALQPAGTGSLSSRDPVEPNDGWFTCPVDSFRHLWSPVGGNKPAGDVDVRTGGLTDPSRLVMVYRSDCGPFGANADVYSNSIEYDMSDMVWRGMCFYLDQGLVNDPTVHFLGTHLRPGSGLHGLSSSTPFAVGPESVCTEPSADKDHSFGARFQWNW